MSYDEAIEFIRAQLDEQGVTQRALADYIGTTEVSVCRYLKGTRTMPYSAMSRALKKFGYTFTISAVRGHREENMKGNIKARIIKELDKALDRFQLWLEQDTELKDEPFDPEWMSEDAYYGKH